MSIIPKNRAAFAVPLVFLCACGGEPASDTDAMTPMASVSVSSPSDGAEVMGPDVTVQLSAAGVRIVLAGDTTSGTGHHHLYLDADLTAADVPVPTVPGSIVHMGDGSSEYTFEGVAAGEHRLIAVVADGVHVPLQPWVVDTIMFTVR